MTTHEANGLGALIILSGPSGAGKSTVCGNVLPHHPTMQFSVSCTTRAPRGQEQDGVDYHFLDMDTFRARAENHEFLEWAEVHGNCYGTLISEVEPPIRQGKDVVLDIDVQGHDHVRETLKHLGDWAGAVVSVFIAPPSMEVLEQRLRGRKTDSEEAILRRLGNARKELSYWRHYDYVIVNEDAQEAARELEAIILASHCRTATQLKEPWA